MTRTERRLTIGFISLLAFGGTGLAAPLTKDEFKCQIAVDKNLSKVTIAKTKCIAKCEQKARKGVVPYSQCEPPYAGDTVTCITEATKGAEAKAIAAMVKGCAKDCPECFAGGCGATGAPAARVAYASNEVDMFVPQIGCENAPAGAPAKCIDTVARTLANFTAARDKCYQKCALAAFKGQTTPSSCQPPAVHPDTATCITRAESKAAGAIDKACFTPPAQAPSCYDGTPPNSSAGWVALTRIAIDGDHAEIFCASASGAFIE